VHEREFHRLKADLDRAHDQVRMLRERLDRDLAAARSSAREREERLLADNERLQGELSSVSQRIRVEHDAELKRAKAEWEGEVKKARAGAELAGAALQRMRAVSGTLERQLAAQRAQGAEVLKLKDELLKINERYKAEFIVLQRRWQDREADVRRQAGAEAEKRFSAEKTAIKLRAQEHLQAQVLKIQAQVRSDVEREAVEGVRHARASMEEELAKRIGTSLEKAQSENRRLEEARRQAEETARKRAVELEEVRRSYEEMRARLMAEEEWKTAASKERLEQEKTVLALREKLRELEGTAGDALARAAAEERRFAALSAERENWAKLRLAYEVGAKKSAAEAESLQVRIAFLESERDKLLKEHGEGTV
jgi:hypothetical protein